MSYPAREIQGAIDSLAEMFRTSLLCFLFGLGDGATIQ
jgi:hypothetical protein